MKKKASKERKKLLDMTESILSKKKQESSLPQPPPPSEKIPKENIQENPVTEDESDRRQPVEEVPEVIEEQLNDFESRLKRLTGED